MNTLRNTLREKYSQIPNDLIIDMSISAGAFRVILYLFSKPDNWNVYNKDICKQLEISEQTLSKYWKSLLKSRWLRRERLTSKDGKFTGGYTYQIGDFPISIKSTDMVKVQDIVTITNNKEGLYTNTKEKIQKEKYPKLNQEAFKMWCSYKGKSYSAQGKALSRNKLMEHSKDIQMQMVENSIMNSYKGLFEIKQNNNGYKDKKPQVGSIAWQYEQEAKQREVIDVQIEAS